MKSWLLGKDSDAGRDWGQEEKGTTEDEMAGQHHWLDGRESQWTPGVGDGQGGLACCDSWGRKESDPTERLIWFDLLTEITRLVSRPSETQALDVSSQKEFSERNVGNLGEGMGFPGIGPLPTCWPHVVSFWTVLVPAVVLFSLLMRYNEGILKLKDYRKSHTPSWI